MIDNLSDEERNSYDIQCYSDMIDWLKEVRAEVQTDKSDEWLNGFNYALLLLTESRRLDRSMPNADDVLTPEWLQENGKRWGLLYEGGTLVEIWHEVDDKMIVVFHESKYSKIIASMFDAKVYITEHLTIHQFKCLMGLLGIKEVEVCQAT